MKRAMNLRACLKIISDNLDSFLKFELFSFCIMYLTNIATISLYRAPLFNEYFSTKNKDFENLDSLSNFSVSMCSLYASFPFFMNLKYSNLSI